jgi:hypothetical protein
MRKLLFLTSVLLLAFGLFSGSANNPNVAIDVGPEPHGQILVIDVGTEPHGIAPVPTHS